MNLLVKALYELVLSWLPSYALVVRTSGVGDNLYHRKPAPGRHDYFNNSYCVFSLELGRTKCFSISLLSSSTVYLVHQERA